MGNEEFSFRKLKLNKPTISFAREIGANGFQHFPTPALFLFGAHLQSSPRMQIMAGQLLESKHNLLQARVEHLELDLGFKAGNNACVDGPLMT